MRQILKRLRGAVGLGLLWAAAGAFAGGMVELVMNLLPGSDLFLGVDLWPAALAIPAFLSGIAFSAVLALVERHRTFAELRVPRVGMLGALGGVLLGLLVGLPAIGVAVLATTSSASAAGTLVLARREPR